MTSIQRDLHPDSRPEFAGADPTIVRDLINAVRARGDSAVRDLTNRFDGVDVADPQVDPRLCVGALNDLATDDRDALELAARHIETFAQAQREQLQPLTVEVAPGVVLGQAVMPVRRVACYVPGGRYPLPSTVLMTVIPARVAGVHDVIVVSPPGPSGLPSPWVLAAAQLAGASAVLAIGGVQAVAAVALGTTKIKRVDLVVGPGNAWVTEAKRQLFGAVGIDSLAGPSEVLVLADETADPARVAADMLAQAEHDPAAEAIAVTDSELLAARIEAEVNRQLDGLPTADIARRSIEEHGAIVVVADRDAMIEWANRRAAEHLHLHVRDPDEAAARCTAYGGLFIGGESAEVFGDYCSGVNHVLPTGGAARYTAGLSVHTFLRTPTWQRLSKDGARSLAAVTARLARIEGLEAHARAAEARDIVES